MLRARPAVIEQSVLDVLRRKKTSPVIWPGDVGASMEAKLQHVFPGPCWHDALLNNAMAHPSGL